MLEQVSLQASTNPVPIPGLGRRKLNRARLHVSTIPIPGLGRRKLNRARLYVSTIPIPGLRRRKLNRARLNPVKRFFGARTTTLHHPTANTLRQRKTILSLSPLIKSTQKANKVQHRST